MLKKMNGMTNMVKKAKQMQENVEKAQETIKNIVIEKETLGVTVFLTGENKIKMIKATDEVFSEEKDVVLDIISSAINQANEELIMKKEEILAEATAGFKIPGII